MATDHVSNSSSVSSEDAAVNFDDSGMTNLCKDLLFDIMCRLSQKDLVKCKMASKSWHQIISDVWLRRFWSQSPVLGLYYRTYHSSDQMNHIINFVFLRDDYPFLERQTVSLCGELRRRQRRDTSDNHLDCCNGLLLLLNPLTYQFCVCNPITKQHVPIPRVSAAQRNYNEQYCAALAYDPIESDHYSVVRIDYSLQHTSSTTTLLNMDIFSSQSRRWVRHGLQLDPIFIEGFKRFKLCRYFVYLRGALYSIASSRKLLCIDLNTIQAHAIELPHVPEDDGDDDKTGETMVCLVGVSMDLVCCVKRDSGSDTFRFWSYDDRRCDHGEKWTLRYSVSGKTLGRKMWCASDFKCHYDETLVFTLYAVSPNSHVLFFGTPKVILSYDFKTERVRLVDKMIDIAATGFHFPCFTLRACLKPFYHPADETNVVSTRLLPVYVSKGEEISSAEVACECDDEPKVSGRLMEVVDKSFFIIHDKRPFFYPSEMQLYGGMVKMKQL